MNQETTNIIQERYALLPQSIAHQITAGPLDRVEGELADTYQLNQQQRVALSNEVTMTLLFFEPLSTLGERLQSALGLDTAITERISEQIYTSIFKPDEALFIDFSLQHSRDVTVNSPDAPQSQPESLQTQTTPPPPASTGENMNPGGVARELPQTPNQTSPTITPPQPQEINQFRTMAEDMKKEETTQPATSQDDLLRKDRE